MSEERFDDEILMAFADGELDPDTHARVARAAAADPEIAARIEDFRRSRLEVRALFEAIVPDRPAEASGVIPFRPRMKAISSGMLWPMALAAGLAALVALPAGYLLAPAGGEAPPMLAVASAAPPELAEALDRLASGESETIGGLGIVRPIASFLDGAERLCREFELERPAPVLAVACSEEGRWFVGLTVALPDDGGYAPASGVDAVEAYLHAIDAGPPLDGEDERRRLSAPD